MAFSHLSKEAAAGIYQPSPISTNVNVGFKLYFFMFTKFNISHGGSETDQSSNLQTKRVKTDKRAGSALSAEVCLPARNNN